jgi:hypothetical protein
LVNICGFLSMLQPILVQLAGALVMDGAAAVLERTREEELATRVKLLLVGRADDLTDEIDDDTAVELFAALETVELDATDVLDELELAAWDEKGEEDRLKGATLRTDVKVEIELIVVEAKALLETDTEGVGDTRALETDPDDIDETRELETDAEDL